MPVAADTGACVAPIRYAFRSFDHQWLIPDARLINRPNPQLWELRSERQVFITAFTEKSPASGPALTVSSLIPDLHHYKGSFGGRVFPLWSDARAERPNLAPGLLTLLSDRFETAVSAEDLFAYIAAIAAHPAHTARFQDDQSTPGLRIPLTAEADTFLAAVELGRRVVWLHSFGERMADAEAGRPPGPPRAPASLRPSMPKEGAIAPDMPLPDELRYDETTQRLHLGSGHIDQVAPAVWAYQVDGKQVIPQWFGYRKRDRSKPPMGDKRPPSPLQSIQPEHWLAEYTSDLIDLLNVLTLLVDLEPVQASLLERVCAGPLIARTELIAAGAIGSDANADVARETKQPDLF